MQSEPKTKRTRKIAEEAPAKRHRTAKKAVEPKVVAAAAAAAGTCHHADHRQIAELAYSYWELRGFQGGSPEDDWYRAEGELRTGQHT
jgi:hypothetical protein